VDSLKNVVKDKPFKWVVAKDGELRGLEMIDPGMTHTMATDGEPVQSAGWGKIVGDKKVQIDNDSGHYQPSKESLKVAKEKFEAAGFDVEIVDSVEPKPKKK
jgi:hypothetical protein